MYHLHRLNNNMFIFHNSIRVLSKGKRVFCSVCVFNWSGLHWDYVIFIQCRCRWVQIWTQIFGTTLQPKNEQHLCKISRSTRFTLPQVNSAHQRYLQGGIIPGNPTYSCLWSYNSIFCIFPVVELQSQLPQVPPELPKSLLVSGYHDLFKQLYNFAKGRLGSKCVVPSQGIWSMSWNRLFMLAKMPSDMELVVEILSKWREMQRLFKEMDAELFTHPWIFFFLSYSLQLTWIVVLIKTWWNRNCNTKG